MKHLMSVYDFLDKNKLCKLFHDAREVRDYVNNIRFAYKPLQGKIIATLFLEPSTRTRLSFESAALRLGASVLSSPAGASLSITKGESLKETIEEVSEYCDLIVVRSPEHYKNWFDEWCHVPIINAGDGGNEHPTQALLDFYTIWRNQGIDHKTYGIAGDVVHSRAIKSFIKLAVKFNPDVNIYVYDPIGLSERPLGENYRKNLYYCSRLDQFEEFLPEIDILYLNRMQLERHSGKKRYMPFVLTQQHLDENLKSTALILNPGPCQEELPRDLRDGRIKVREQVQNGLYIRMALLLSMLKP